MAQRGAAAPGAPAAATEPLPAGVTPTADARRLLSRDTLRALVQHVLGEQARALGLARGACLPLRLRNPDFPRHAPFLPRPAFLSDAQVAPEVEELLLDVGDDFLEHVAAGSAALARHRGAAMLEASDVRLHVERVWNMPLPGHGADEVEPMRLAGETETHRARLAAVRRTAAFHAAASEGAGQGR